MSNPRTKAAAILLLSCAVLCGAARADGTAVRPPAGRGGEEAAADGASGHAPLALTLDFAKIVSFPEPAKDIIIGNPAIVDGTLSDQRTMVLTAKAIGTTNMIVLGAGGKEIANLVVSVSPNGNRRVTVYSGDREKAYSCFGPCETAVVPKDESRGAPK